MLIMEDKYTHSIIDNTLQMIYDLQYLGRNNRKTLKDLTKLKILNMVYQWVEWYHISEQDKWKIERLMNSIILSNSNLYLPSNIPGINYSSVNIPSDTKMWRRVSDNPDATIWELVEP